MRNFKFVLILAAPFDKGGTPAVVKILAICFGVTERPLDVHDEVHKRLIIWFYMWYMWSDANAGINDNYIKIAVFSLIVSSAVTGHLESSEESETVSQTL